MPCRDRSGQPEWGTIERNARVLLGFRRMVEYEIDSIEVAAHPSGGVSLAEVSMLRIPAAEHEGDKIEDFGFRQAIEKSSGHGRDSGYE